MRPQFGPRACDLPVSCQCDAPWTFRCRSAPHFVTDTGKLIRLPTFTSVSHIDLSVADVEKSATWYVEVLGLVRVKRADLDTRTMVVLYHEATGLVIGLNQHRETKTERFDEHNVGLDHIGFAVNERGELDDWQRRLAELAVEHSPVADTPVGSALVFRDPDNIQLEFWWTHSD